MDVWTSHSSQGKHTALSVGCIATGLLLAYGFRDFDTGGTNTLAGFLLGMLLLVIGAANVFVSGRQTVVVDPRSRRITVEDSNRFRTKQRTIQFADITDISIGFVGKKSNFVSFYYLILELRNGEHYPLFAPGRFFEGSSSRTIVDGWRRRLRQYLGFVPDEYYP